MDRAKDPFTERNCPVYMLSFVKLTKFMEDKGKFAVFIAAISPIPYFPFLIGALPFKRINFYIFGIIPRIIGLVLAATVIYYFLEP